MSSSSYWEHFDFMSVEAKLYVNGKDRYKTKLGFIMTSVSFISIFILSCFFFKSFFEKIDVNIVFLRSKTDQTLYIDLNNKPFMYRLKDIDNVDVDPRLVSITVKYFYFTDNIDDWETLETEPCAFDKHLPDPKYRKMFQNVAVESHTCIKSNRYNLNITDDPVNNKLYYFNIYINDCNNSTMNNNSCFPTEVIKEYTSTANIYFSYYFPSFALDHYNTTVPLQESFSWTEKKIYFDMYYGYSDNIKLVNYTSDEGMVMQEFKSWSYFGIDPSSSYVDISLSSTVTVPNTRSSFTIMLVPGKVDLYKRTYPKIQYVFANIGGLLKIISTISSVFTKFITSQILDVELSNNFISGTNKERDNNNLKVNHNHNNYNNNNINYNFSPTINNSAKKLVKLTPKFSTMTILSRQIQNPSRSVSISDNSKLYSFNLKPDKSLKTASNYRELSFIEALLPSLCLNHQSAKHNLQDIRKIIRSYLSTEYILRLHRDFINLKNSIFNEKENELLNHMRCPTVEEHYRNIRIKQKRQSTIEINNLLREVELSENINKQIIKNIMEEE